MSNLMINQNLTKAVSPSSGILPGIPWLIAHRSMIKVNKPYKFTLNHRDYVMWQNNQGEVFALADGHKRFKSRTRVKKWAIGMRH